MSLKTRLIWLTALWITFVLTFFNVFIYYYFVNISSQSEIKLLWNKAQIILRNPAIRVPDNWLKPHLLEEFLEADTMIRIIGPDGIVKTQAYTNEALIRNPPVYRTNYHTKIENEAGTRMLFIQVPIFHKDKQVGVLELGKALKLLSDYLDILFTSLMVATAGTLFFSIVGGFFYTRLIFRPIGQLVQTMQMIQKSGTFERLGEDFTSKRDELGKLGTAFNEMIERLEENYKKQKQFVADASHELRTPLTIIESYASLLQRWASSDEKLREEAIQAIHSEVNHLKTLIQSMLNLADTNRETSMRKEKVRLLPLIESTVRSLEKTLRRGISLQSNADDIVLDADPGKIKQLLVILLDNAIKYSRKPVQVIVNEAAAHVTLQIIDQGIGIHESEIPRLFERFYRVDRARSRDTGGVGLGLSIAERIVNMHGGTIEIASEVGKGTTVTVQLPKS